jgi:hypothetical protein
MPIDSGQIRGKRRYAGNPQSTPIVDASTMVFCVATCSGCLFRRVL